MFQFNPIGLLALIAFLMCLGLAVVLFRSGLRGSPARRLSLLLVVEGVALFSTGYIDMFLSAEVHALPGYPLWLRVEEVVHTLGDCAMLALYPQFLGAALKTPLTRPFTSKKVQIGISSAATLLFFAVFFTPLTVGATLLYLLLVLLFTYALVASVHAWHISDGAARARAGSFAVAFGFRDICWSYSYGAAIWMIWSGTYAVVEPDGSGAPYLFYALGTLIAVPLIAYGILRTQLFDIDLRIRWTIKQSTVASVFIAVMFVVSEGASQFLSDELGKVTGLLAAGILMFFLAPLQRFADRVAGTAMPNTKNTPEYAAFRKMQVYEAAVTEALEGGVSSKERALLVRLRDSLEISESDAAAIEQELSARSRNDLHFEKEKLDG